MDGPRKKSPRSRSSRLFLPGPAESALSGLGGMTADELASDPSQVFLMILIHTSDAINGSYAGLGPTVSKWSAPPADGWMSFLVAEAVTRLGEVSVEATPIPGALPLFATGLAALGLFGWRRKRTRAT